MHRFARAFAFVLCALLGVSAPALAQGTGWTNLAPPPGAQVFYVANSGSDSNPGTQAAPFRSIQRGYAALRDGQPDQVLLRCGDTWNESAQINITKGCNTPGQYIVIGSYGAGPRPKLTFPVNGFRGESLGKRRAAITGLEIAGTNTNETSGIIMLSWHDVLIEDCLIRNFRDNIVVQDVASNGSFRVLGLKIRRNVVVDAKYTGAPSNGRSQGFYIGGCDGWLIEGNVFDRCGIEGSIFSHNGYVHQTCGAGTYRDNITARSPSEGVQQRPGGNMINNLALANSYGLYMGSTTGAQGLVSYNVVLDSKDINPIDRRGIGLLIDGSNQVTSNVAAHNVGGTGLGSVKGMAMRDFTGTVSGNMVYDWPNPIAAESQCYHFEDGGTSPVTFTGNGGFQPQASIVLELNPNRSTVGFTSYNNRYWSALTILPAFRPLNWNTWRSAVGEAGTTFAPVAPVNAKISTYMKEIGFAGGLDEFMVEARKQGKQNWRTQFTALGVNEWVRAKFGMPLMGGGTPACYANCDASTTAPVLNVMDFSCFMERYASGNPYANCDGSLAWPQMTANDFLCFINKYTQGCP